MQQRLPNSSHTACARHTPERIFPSTFSAYSHHARDDTGLRPAQFTAPRDRADIEGTKAAHVSALCTVLYPAAPCGTCPAPADVSNDVDQEIWGWRSRVTPPPRVGDDTPIFPAKHFSPNSAPSQSKQGQGGIAAMVNSSAGNPVGRPVRSLSRRFASKQRNSTTLLRANFKPCLGDVLCRAIYKVSPHQTASNAPDK